MQQPFTQSQPVLDPEVAQSRGHSAGFGRTALLWLAANLVVTTMLTGTLFVPSLRLGTAVLVILGGTLAGAVVLILVGNMGTRTGLPTMMLTRFAFGRKGSIVPATANLIVLMGWSWVQAILAGVTVNAVVAHYTGFDHPALFSVLCQALVVGLAVFGHEGIAKVEPWFAAVILGCMGWVFWRALTEFSLADLAHASGTGGTYTPSVAFDAVVATAISWTVLSADFNRHGRGSRQTMAGTLLGYVTSTSLAMSMGAVAALYVVIRSGASTEFDPVPLVEHFGLPIALCVFLSVVATNTMVVYGMVTSSVNVVPRAGRHYVWTVVVVGGISILGATQVGLLAYFTDFLLLIGAFFVPVFAIMLCDYYLKNRGRYGTDLGPSGDTGILATVSSSFRPEPARSFDAGVPVVRWQALGAWLVGAVASYVFAYVIPVPIGATASSFLVTFAVYATVSRPGSGQFIHTAASE